MTHMLTIGRLGALAGLEPKTLRYYDRVGLVRPGSRTTGGYRLYGEEAVARLEFVRRAKALGMSLADIRRTLAVRDEGAAPCRHVLELVSRNLVAVESQLERLRILRADLTRLRRQLQRDIPADARAAEDCPCFDIIRSFQKPERGRPPRRSPRHRSRAAD